MVSERVLPFSAALPPGYTGHGFAPGREDDGAVLRFAAGHTETKAQAAAIFEREFLTRPDLLSARGLSAVDPDGQSAATASLWAGTHLGRVLPRVHWSVHTTRCTPQGACRRAAHPVVNAGRAAR